jgi:hypothetical protein
MEPQSEFREDRRELGQETSQQIGQTAQQERHKNARLAHELAQEARQQWRRSIEGMLALPTAAALGVASTTLYMGAFVERGFEILQQSAEAMRASTQQVRRELRRDFERERGGDGPRYRLDVQRGQERGPEGRPGEAQA